MPYTPAAPLAADTSAHHEAHRQLALHQHGILNAAPEPDFDALVRIAAQALGMPMAAITFVDADRLWTQASVGFTPQTQRREGSLCAQALHIPDELLLIHDLQAVSADRIGTAPSPDARAYAATVLCDAQGHALGTLVVMATQPRTLDAAAQHTLRDLGRVAMSLLHRRHQERELTRLTTTDLLTGLGNRALFDRAVHAEMSHAMRTGEPFTVLHMDLDGFKDITNGFGHGAGLEVLREVARRLDQQVRAGDVLVRFDGDQFGVVVRQGDETAADALTQRIRKAVTSPITLSSGDTVGVGIAVGAVTYTDDMASVQAMLRAADQALFQSKRENEHRWKVFMGVR